MRCYSAFRGRSPSRAASLFQLCSALELLETQFCSRKLRGTAGSPALAASTNARASLRDVFHDLALAASLGGAG